MTKEHGVTKKKKLETSYQQFLVSMKEEMKSPENKGGESSQGLLSGLQRQGKSRKGKKREGERKKQQVRRESELLSQEGVATGNGYKSNLSFGRPNEVQSINMDCMCSGLPPSEVTIYNTVTKGDQTQGDEHTIEYTDVL